MTNLLSLLSILWQTNLSVVVSTSLVPVITETHLGTFIHMGVTNSGLLYQTQWVANRKQVRVLPPPPAPSEPPQSKVPPTPTITWLRKSAYTGALERVIITNGPTRLTVIKHTDAKAPVSAGAIGGPQRKGKSVDVVLPGPKCYDSFIDSAPLCPSYFVTWYTNIPSGTLKMQVSPLPPPNAIWQTLVEQDWINSPGAVWGLAIHADNDAKYERMLVIPR